MADASPYGPLFDADMNPLYTSASQLQTADHESEAGCLRKWHFEKVAKRKPPQTKSQATGTTTHNEIERHIKTGDMSLGPLSLTARRLIPSPSDPRFAGKLAVEVEIGDTGRVAADGVRVVGKIDLDNHSGYYLTGDGEVTEEWRSCVELNDWKTTASVDYIKSPPEVARSLQMTAYGVWAIRTHDVERVRLSHVYMITRGQHPAVKRTSVIEAEDVFKRWEYAAGLQRSIRHAAKIPADQSNLVDANGDACGAYRGCPHRSYCNPPPRTESMASLFRAYTSDSGETMSLLATFGITNPVSHTVPNPAPPATDPVAAQVAALKAAEVSPPPRPKSAFELACEDLQGAGWGFPPLGGDAAVARATLQGVQLSAGAALAGSGRLATVQTITDPAVVVALAAEVKKAAADEKAAAAAPVVAMPALLPPDAPASNPVLAADPVPGFMGTPEAPPKEAKKRGPGRPKKADTVAPAVGERTAANPAFPATLAVAEAARPETILKHFTYAHLPERLQAVSAPICDLATDLVAHLPQCAERTAGLRKLLEAKDCFVRAALEASS